MDCLSEEVLDSEFSDDSRVWVILDKADPHRYLLFPKNADTLALWAFMKREDAEHLILLLKTLAPDYKEMELVIADDQLREVRAGAKENNGVLCVMPPIDSMEFFGRYEGLLGSYFGLQT
jgi:hypothetical protein